MSDWNNSDLQRTITEVLRRSALDPSFRALALRDGAAAMARVDKRPLPADMRFRFVDNSGREKTIPLPDLLENSDELGDAVLEHVSGGTDGPPPTVPPITLSGGWSKLARRGPRK